MKIGSLFTGYGGLDTAVKKLWRAETIWASDNDPGAAKIIDYRLAGVPNLGDITKINWTEVEPVDILTGGYPCQPFSAAGKRHGTDDERHLWPFVAEALSYLRPTVAVFENVRGHLTLGFDHVLRDLQILGYSVQWRLLRASDIGAPHGRARIFILATDRQLRGGTDRRRGVHRHSRVGRIVPGPAQSGDDRQGSTGTEADAGYLWGQDRGAASRRPVTPGGLHLASHRNESRQRDPEPATAAVGQGRCCDDRIAVPGDGGCCSATAERQGVMVGAPADESRGIPRPDSGREPARARSGPDATQEGTGGDLPLGGVVGAAGRPVGRPAPDPTVNGRLSPRFAEWMMGLPEGWVCDVPGLTRAQQLKALGNGVVWQQAAAALHHMTQGQP